MIALLPLLLQAVSPPPQDWSGLPVFPLPRAGIANDGTPYVRGEVAAGRCRPGQGPARLDVPVAMLVADGGRVTRIVPRAIGCATVEQFTVGMLIALTRGGPGTALPPTPGWYQLTVTYTL